MTKNLQDDKSAIWQYETFAQTDRTEKKTCKPPSKASNFTRKDLSNGFWFGGPPELASANSKEDIKMIWNW